MGDAMGIKAPVEEEDEKKTQQAMQLGKAGAGSGAGDGATEAEDRKGHGSDDEGAVDYRKSSKYVLVCCAVAMCRAMPIPRGVWASPSLWAHSSATVLDSLFAGQICRPHEGDRGLL